MRSHILFVSGCGSTSGSSSVHVDHLRSTSGVRDGYRQCSVSNFTHTWMSMCGTTARYQVAASLSSGREGDPQDVARSSTNEGLQPPYLED